ncbi:hypothetical protein PR003_g31443 [Phytophthora rubi]|uniref:Uncharacterized protein n=1 Tax=Phytophthora rubi TaxID=129364 RepID=A0A6A4B859_9STRA|nr:hypothetical protein PR003_g31443 [Phytophthora rubi]
MAKPRTSMLTLVLVGMVYHDRVCLHAKIPVAHRCSHTKAAVVCLIRLLVPISATTLLPDAMHPS